MTTAHDYKVDVGTLKEALVTLREATRVLIHVSIDARLFDDPNSVYPDSWRAGVAVTKQAARAMLEDMFDHWDKNSAHDTNKYFRMSVHVSTGPLVRNRSGELVAGKPVKAVWIGA